MPYEFNFGENTLVNLTLTNGEEHFRGVAIDPDVFQDLVSGVYFKNTNKLNVDERLFIRHDMFSLVVKVKYMGLWQ